ncbi:head GIN domain-containing protein [Solitalea koreensis]|uniref:Auto-transporter adhesin, head GIN domain n=1 Tax=Solitalea koreensis TaxID=543615 RepID=A0A521C5P6_9SPHI|nr:head GIN domain-containing protein [Solitalea koreensis]SMO54749.1 Putative auto-transporter adhesin, head GIN domain [Solitalea koreensis]
MKPLNKIALITTTAIVGFSLISFTQTELTTNKSAKATTEKKAIPDTEIRNVSGFTGIKSSNGIDVFISQGTTERVEVKADAETMKHLRTEVKNGVLEIYMESNWNGLFSGKSHTTEVHVTAKTLNSLTASSGSDVKTLTKIKADKFSAKASSGSDLTLNIEVNEFSFESSSGSDATITGSAKVAHLKSSSGSDIEANKLMTEVCEAQASSGSNISVSVSKQLKAVASSGGDISYHGNPSVSKEESSGGEVSKD